jgi:hypothetical protein
VTATERRRWFRRIALAASLTGALAAAETIVARVAPQPIYSLLDASSPRCFRASDVLPYELEPGARTRLKQPEFDLPIAINGQGLRMDREVERARTAGRPRWLVVGDSFVFGYGVESAQAIPAVLERYLAKREHPVEFLNLGFACAFSPDCYYAGLRREPRFDADGVIVAAYVGNDFTVRAETSWDEVDEHGLPKRVSAPTQEVDDDHRWRIKNGLLRYRIPLLRDSHLFVGAARVLRPGLTTGDEYGQVLRRVFDARFYGEAWTPEIERSFADIIRCLAGLRDLVERRGQHFLVAVIPTVDQVYAVTRESGPRGVSRIGFGLRTAPRDEVPQRRIAAALAAAKVDSVDLLGDLVAAHEHGLYFQQDNHLTVRGCEVAASVLEHALDERGWIAR